jgi:hypothetical protein
VELEGAAGVLGAKLGPIGGVEGDADLADVAVELKEEVGCAVGGGGGWLAIHVDGQIGGVFGAHNKDDVAEFADAGGFDGEGLRD